MSEGVGLSVVAPVYNEARVLAELAARCAAAALQADATAEVLLVDDASTDDTPAVAATLQAPVRVLRLAKNRRQFGATQSGLAAAQGAPAPSSFVQTNGSQFTLEGRPFYFAGANTYDFYAFGSGAGSTETSFMNKTLIDLHMATLADSGVRVLSYPKRDLELPAIRLNYPKLVAATGPCGTWPDDLGPSVGRSYTENRTFYNFGCAHQRNLAAMVDNPSDLIQPRAETPAYTARRSVALDKYRKGESPAGKYDRYEQSKISDLGK